MEPPISINCIYYEHISNGTLFDYILNTGMHEDVAKYFFKQLITGLEYCSSRGICHRDLKPDNLLVDHNYNLKIADFGFAAHFSGRHGNYY